MDVKQDVVTGISVTLNGGKKEMNSATIPIAWWLSEEVIKKAPKYILIFEQDEEEKNDLNGAMYRGRRYLCKVSDAFKFISIFSPGRHRIMTLAVQDISDFSVTVGDYLKKERNWSYVLGFDWEKAERGSYMRSYVCAVTVVEFEVPEELFVKKPETKAGALIWKWANLLHSSGPRDKCEYLKRKVIAFTLQPPLMAVWLLLKYGIGGTVHAMYVLLASLVVFFAGFRPRPILKEMWRAFTLTRDPEWNVCRYDTWDMEKSSSVYRVWSISIIRKDGERVQKVKYMPIAPFVVVLIGIVGALTYYLIRSLIGGRLTWLLPYAIALACVIFIALFVKVISPYFAGTVSKRKRKMREKREIKAAKTEKTRKEKAQKWILENLALSQKTDAVYLDRLPTPPDLRGKVVQRFRVSYWTLKAKVCRPFAR